MIQIVMQYPSATCPTLDVYRWDFVIAKTDPRTTPMNTKDAALSLQLKECPSKEKKQVG